jgi:hypothetical protein
MTTTRRQRTPRPRDRRRSLGRRAASALVAGAGLLLGAFAVAPPASAATYDVPCGAAWLVAAIEQVNGIPGGNTLNLAPGCTYTFTSRYGDTEWALPNVSGTLTINGNGAIIERSTSAQSMGIAQLSADVLLSDVTLREFWGFNGAYFFVGGSLVLVDSLITNVPPTGQQDAALKVGPSGELAVIDSTIERQTNFDGGGGAIENQGHTVVTGSVLQGDTSFGDFNIGGVGGAIVNSGTAEIYGSTFSGNSSGGTGGHIRNAGSLTIEDSSFVNGSSNFGAAIANSSDLVVERSYFEGNHANIGGGAIYNNSTGLATVRNATFYRNRSGGDGGAVLNNHGANIAFSTFSQNVATSDGQTFASPGGIIAAKAVILDGPGDHCSGSISDFGYDVVGTSLGSCPGTFTVGDPALTGPALRGGTTKTMALGVGSAAFDAAGTTGCPSTDQRGLSRPVGAACDVGALEDQAPTAPGAPTLAGGSSSPNQGTFGLTWTAGTDPDGTPVSYQLRHRASDQADFSQVATPAGTSYSFVSPESEGSYVYDLIATDGNLSSSPSGDSGLVVVDRTAPATPTASADRAPDYVGDLDWYADTVTVSFSGSTDPDLADGSTGSGLASTTSAQTFSTSGEHTATGTSTDHAGNESDSASLTVHVDATAPSVGFDQCPADVTLGSTTQALWSSSDAHSGLSTPASGGIGLDTTTIGTKSVTANATDNVGHSASATCTYRVIYDYTGFFRPLVAPPAYLDTVAGNGVSVSFSLAGFQGLGVLAAGYPQSAPITCGTSPELTSGQATSSRKGLTFTKGKPGQYTYLWATDPAWTGTCRQLVVKLADGTYHRANVRFG